MHILPEINVTDIINTNTLIIISSITKYYTNIQTSIKPINEVAMLFFPFD